MEFMTDLNELGRVALALAFMAVAAGVSRWQHADLEKDIFWAALRGFIQLIAIGYVLELIFAGDSPLWTLLVLAVMITVAGRTAGQRAKKTPHARLIAWVAIAFGSALTIGLLVALDVFAFEPQSVIPIGGMIVGNAMTTAALTMTRFSDDLIRQKGQVESMLALGATGRKASELQFRDALRSAMLPSIDTTKTVGLIKLPGAMTGMILAGASPLEAVRLQLIVMYMLVGANTFTGMAAAYLTYRQFFTPSHQLVIMKEAARG